MKEKEIGGYFELEIPKGDLSQIYPGILVNSGRHALEYILRALGNRVKCIWLPYYTCDVVLEPIKRLNLNFQFYHINENLELTEMIELKEGHYLIVNNYFGIKDRYVSEMSRVYGSRLIVDNAQAWYAHPEISSNTIYSPRKFFGLPDGGLVSAMVSLDQELPEGFSADRCSHLLKRIDSGATSGYEDFRNNSRQLKEEALTRMSALTERLLCQIDFGDVKVKRKGNFITLHQALATTNKLQIPQMTEFECPMVYPYLTDDPDLRKRLIENKVFVATYWPNVFDWAPDNSLEYHLTRYLLPLPIDQRYDYEDMKRIIELITKK